MARKPKLGTGKRTKKLVASLSHRKGIRDPKAVAASIGRKNHGAKKMAQLSAAGRRRKRGG